MNILSLLTETGSLYKYTTVMSIHMKTPQDCIRTTITIIVITQPMNIAPTMMKTVQPMKTDLASMQPINTAPYIPKILHIITNKVQWIIRL